MSELRERVIAYNTEVKAAIRSMFERYGVETE